MLLKVDLQSTQPLHDQLAGQIRSSIAAGDLARGDRLPPARELADSLGINVHTMLRAYQALRDEGLLEVRRGRGTIVTGVAPALASLTTLARSLVAEARRAGLDNTAIHDLIEEQL
ncbi:MAG: GntR family transcriptional regulator [Acidimicrobiales bacterium]